jgi:hypothetical protein
MVKTRSFALPRLAQTPALEQKGKDQTEHTGSRRHTLFSENDNRVFKKQNNNYA